MRQDNPPKSHGTDGKSIPRLYSAGELAPEHETGADPLHDRIEGEPRQRQVDEYKKAIERAGSVVMRCRVD
jgi:hypothetical protein